jgi:hypothetical protein
MNPRLLSRDALISQIATEVDKALDSEIRRSELESGLALTFPKACFDQTKIEASLSADLRSELSRYEEYDYFPGCSNENGELILRGLFNQIEHPEYSYLHTYFWEAYTDPAERVSDWIQKHIGEDVELWAEVFLSTPAMESLRVANSIEEWNVEAVAYSFVEGLLDLAKTGKLSMEDSLLKVLGGDEDYKVFGARIIRINVSGRHVQPSPATVPLSQ